MEGVAIITGGTKGLGSALVAKWLSEGWAVGTCARSEQEISKLQLSHSVDVLMAKAFDIADPSACWSFVRSVEQRLGCVDVLINNASVLGPRTEIVEYPDDDWRTTIDINVDGTFFMTKAVLAGMLERRSGVILNISSGAGIKGKARWGAYAASKFAVEGLTQVLRDEVQDRGIRVHAIDPGAMRTEMRAAAYPEEDPLTPPEPHTIANVIFDIAAVYEPQLCRLAVRDYL